MKRIKALSSGCGGLFPPRRSNKKQEARILDRPDGLASRDSWIHLIALQIPIILSNAVAVIGSPRPSWRVPNRLRDIEHQPRHPRQFPIVDQLWIVTDLVVVGVHPGREERDRNPMFGVAEMIAALVDLERMTRVVPGAVDRERRAFTRIDRVDDLTQPARLSVRCG